MSIASTLNIAKEALLTHMSAITVTGHNIANVNTPGYSRQVQGLTTSVATPSGAGFLGNGVRAESIRRQYDLFMTQRIMSQNSTINNLKTQQQSMRLVETAFNEVPGLALNELLGKFWESWQALSNNPELSSNRQTVIQQAELLNVQMQTMNAQLAQTKFDIDVSIKSSIDAVNSLTQQLADINGKITASETPQQEQNDLRDTRDNLLKELAGYLDITYYEGNNGADTVMLTDGHSLVNNNESWSLSWTGGKLQWVNINSKGQSISADLDNTTVLGGSIGGLLETFNQLEEGNPDNYLGRLDALANALIREVNQIHTQGVGMVSFSDELTSAELAKNAILLHTTVDTNTAAETLAAGSLEINGRSIGRIDGSVTTYGLVMGKTANAAAAINEAAAGVLARMTTQVAGGAVTAMAPAEVGQSLDFTVNGVAVSYTVQAADSDPTVLATNVVAAINTAITNYNNDSGLTPPQVNLPRVTLEALVGNGENGGAEDSIILKNTNKGDESSIVIGGVASAGVETKLNLTNGTYQADSTHNTGELSIFSNDGPIEIDGGADDTKLAHLGWAGTVSYSDQAATSPTAFTTISFDLNGRAMSVANIPAGSSAATVAQMAVTEINRWSTNTGVSAEVGDGTNGGPLNSVVFSNSIGNIRVSNYTVDLGDDVLGFGNFAKLGVAAADETPDDGQLAYEFSDNGINNSLMGLDYADTLKLDGGSFDLWLYNKDGSLALAQPVTIDLTRAYTLNDVATTINSSIAEAINDPTIPAPTPWVQASVVGNQLVFRPDSNHNFAFGNDTSNFLAAMGVNTFFTGHNVGTIGINTAVSANLNQLAAGRVNEYGEIFAGDNSNALLITAVQRNENITFTGQGSSTDSFDGFYNTLIAEVGLKGKTVTTDLSYNEMVSTQLSELRDATSGVSLDEEMSNLIKFQHAYSAAAKLISASDEMLKTILETVQR